MSTLSNMWMFSKYIIFAEKLQQAINIFYKFIS